MKYRLYDVFWFRDNNHNYYPFVIDSKNDKIKFILTNEVVNLSTPLENKWEHTYMNRLNEKDVKILNNVKPNLTVANHTRKLHQIYWFGDDINAVNLMKGKLHSNVYFKCLANKMSDIEKKEINDLENQAVAE